MSLRNLLAALLLSVSAAAVADSPKTVVLDVENMNCSLCPLTVRKALEKVAGPGSATVDFKAKTATVHFDPARTTVAALAKASTDAGYPARERR